METKPLLIVQSSKRISTEKAYKAIAKFAQQEAAATSSLPDDVTSKLTTLETELRSIVENGKNQTVTVNVSSDGGGKKKRKKENECDETEEKTAKKMKKEKKDKKDKIRSEIIPVDINQVLSTSKQLNSADSSLVNMKKAVSKMK